MTISAHRPRWLSPVFSARQVAASGGVLLGSAVPGWLLATATDMKLETYQISAASSFWSVLLSNLGVVVCLALGAFTLGILTMAILSLNGMVLGAAGQLFVGAGRTADLWTGLAPHFLPEVAAFVLAASADLWLVTAIWGWLRRGGAPSRAQFAQRWVAPHLATLALLGIAAFLETFVSTIG